MSGPIVKELVLVGAGHSHSILLKMWGMNPLPGVRLTLITESVQTPYSGMLPGYVAGFYRHEQCHIDVRRLGHFAGARVWLDPVVGLDLEKQQVLCQSRPPIPFDVLSINIGSKPATVTVPGAAAFAVPAKPIAGFLAAWSDFLTKVADQPLPAGRDAWQLVIVGGGAGGVELALNMEARLRALAVPVQIHLVQRGPTLIPAQNRWVRRRLATLLTTRGVQVHLGTSVTQVKPDGVMCERADSSQWLASDQTFWVTQAGAPAWLDESGLATDERGFMALAPTLASTSHPQVFGAGDVGTVLDFPRPKAGVFAVRQGKPLFENVRRALRGQALVPFRPQKEFLQIIGTGERRAIAAKAWFGWESRLMWQWKEWIEFRFMRRFQNLPVMEMARPVLPSGLTDAALDRQLADRAMICSGCGSKVGRGVLTDTLQRLQQEGWLAPEMSADGQSRGEVPVGLRQPDDGAVLVPPPGAWWVQTVDQFRAVLADPYVFGQIATHHCLNDLYAMGATPHSVMALVTLPWSEVRGQRDSLYLLLRGAALVLQPLSVPLVGGHTTEGPELTFGLVANGLVEPAKLWRKGDLRAGHTLILTKPLGSGVLLAGMARGLAQGDWLEGAIASMLQSNWPAVAVFRQYGAIASTDISGFGLAVHLLEMVQARAAEGEALTIQLHTLPQLPGAAALLAQGVASSLAAANREAAQPHLAIAPSFAPHMLEYPAPSAPETLPAILFDPQTAGGLVAAVPQSEAAACLAALQAVGLSDSTIIGTVTPYQTAPLYLVG